MDIIHTCTLYSTHSRNRPAYPTRGAPGRTSDPLAMDVVPRLPRKSGGDQGAPEGRQGVHPTPWQWTLCHACHAKAAETKRPRDARGTPGRTSDPVAVQIAPHLPRKSQRSPRDADARAYIRPLGSADYPTPATQKPPEPKGRQRYVYMYMSMYAYMYICICMYVYIYIYIDMCVCVCVCVCVYVYIYICVCMYIYI